MAEYLSPVAIRSSMFQVFLVPLHSLAGLVLCLVLGLSASQRPPIQACLLRHKDKILCTVSITPKLTTTFPFDLSEAQYYPALHTATLKRNVLGRILPFRHWSVSHRLRLLSSQEHLVVDSKMKRLFQWSRPVTPPLRFLIHLLIPRTQ